MNRSKVEHASIHIASMRAVMMNRSKVEHASIHIASMRAVVMNRSKVEHARYTYSQHEGSGDEQK